MRYELHLLSVPPGADPAAASAALAAGLAGEGETGPLDPRAEAWKRGLAAALTELDPRLEVLEVDHATLAALAGIGEEEARRRNRALELAGPEEGGGVEVTLLDDGAAVSLPYGHQGEKAVRAWREGWSVVEVLCRIGGLTPYDPQLGRPLDLAADIGAVLDRYGGARPGAAPPAEGNARRPWWKVW